jgi:hypothetical protein
LYAFPQLTLGARLNERLVTFIPGGLGMAGFGRFGMGAALSVLVLGVILSIHVFLNRREVSHALANPDPGSGVRSQSRFQQSLRRYCQALVAELERYDREVNWSDRELTPLEAEIEVERGRGRRQRIARDLVDAIRSDRKSSVFLVLGDPGSGKSVSMRRLVRLLCQQALETGVVPVYANLREYPPGEEPSNDSLVRFIRQMALRQTGRDGRAFLDTWYESFRMSGRLFFVLDSFDELPVVLDCDERSDQHKRVSATFDRLFTQELQGCRCVLASRHFRAPVSVRGARLSVRPFTERQIRSAMGLWLLEKGVDANHYVQELFRDRPHLIPALRNPFTAELLAEYAVTRGGNRLPDNLYIVFQHYLSQRFETDQAELARLGFAPDAVRKGAGIIASAMYESGSSGLELQVEEVKAILKPTHGIKAEEMIEALRFTRLARVGGAGGRWFSFVHRRFAEFFVVDMMKDKHGGVLKTESIPTDSRWRDCLVMYCGIATDAERVRIAAYCWSIIDSSRVHIAAGELSRARGAVHCIRFLADAFRADAKALADFRSDLGELTTRLVKAHDVLVAKIGAELLPLIGVTYQSGAFVVALSRESRWVRDTALGACRHLADLDLHAAGAVRRFVRGLPLIEFLVRFADLSFSLSLSDSFRSQRRALWADLAELLLVVAGACWLVVVVGVASPFVPILACCIGMFAAAVVVAVRDWRERRRSLRQRHFLESSTPGLDLFLSDDVPLAYRDILDIFLRLLVLLLVIATAENRWTEWLPVGTPPKLTSPGAQAALAVILAACFGWERMVLPTVSLLRRLVRMRFRLPGSERDTSYTTRSLRKTLREALLLLGSSIAVLAMMAGVVYLVVLLVILLGRAWDAVPEWLRAMLISGGVVLLWGLVITAVVACLWRPITSLITVLCDRRHLRRIGFPASMKCDEVYRNTLAFRSPAGRTDYLHGLRTRRVPIVGPVEEPPDALTIDPGVEDELARLREQWLGLDG